jgi:sugar lactone lactonase YvrE
LRTLRPPSTFALSLTRHAHTPLPLPRAAAAILLALLTAGCARNDAGPAPQGEWGGTPWRLVEEARIGAADGSGPDVFGSVVDVTLDPLGRAWVADGQAREIRVFGARGEHVRTIGGRGGGPAEFGAIAGMRWAGDDRLWVLDGGNARFAVYDTAGTLVETRPRTATFVTSPWPGRFDREGRLYDVDGTVAPDGSITTYVVRNASDGASRDTFHLPHFEPELFELRRGDARNRTVSQVNVPFTGSQFWALDPEGYVWIANTARYRIERHRFDGGVARVVERPHTPPPVTRAERQSRLDGLSDFVRQGGRIDPARIPDTHPALHGFLFDDAGHLWVSPVTSAEEGRVLDVFRLDGSHLGRAALPTPARSSPRAIRGDRMLVVARDSLDVPTVIVLRIEKPAG